jgi:hypothetical protein
MPKDPRSVCHWPALENSEFLIFAGSLTFCARSDSHSPKGTHSFATGDREFESISLQWVKGFRPAQSWFQDFTSVYMD